MVNINIRVWKSPQLLLINWLAETGAKQQPDEQAAVGNWSSGGLLLENSRIKANPQISCLPNGISYNRD